MIRDPLTFTVTQALDDAHSLNAAAFHAARMARQQSGSFEASQLLEISAELLQAEYYTSLNHLHQCLRALFEDPTLARDLAVKELLTPLEYVKAMRTKNQSSGVSEEIPATTSESSEPSGTLYLSPLGTTTPEIPPQSSSD